LLEKLNNRFIFFITPTSTLADTATPLPGARSEYYHSPPDPQSSELASTPDDTSAPTSSTGSCTARCRLTHQAVPCFIQISELTYFRHAHIRIAIVPVPARARRCPIPRNGHAVVLAPPEPALVSKQMTRPGDHCSVSHNPLQKPQHEYRFHRATDRIFVSDI